jgi:uncharacterized membrane protein YvbJ
MNFCSKCGNGIKSDQKFCDNCGTAINLNEKTINPSSEPTIIENTGSSTEDLPKIKSTHSESDHINKNHDRMTGLTWDHININHVRWTGLMCVLAYI